MSSDNYVKIDDASYTLGLSDAQILKLVKSMSIDILTINGRKSIKQSDYKKIAKCDQILNLRYIVLAKTAMQDSKIQKNKSDQNKIDIYRIVKKNTQYINLLEEIHKKYLRNFDVIHNESTTTAAYLVFSKIISLLKISNLCYSNNYDASIHLRLIDESINLANYFIITQQSENGKKILKEWFRENKSPKNVICRQAISDFMKPQLTNHSDFEEAIKKIYQLKSKSIHSSYNSIIETLKTEIKHGDFIIAGFEYGQFSKSHTLLEQIDFFLSSSILNAYKIFLFCFQYSIPLESSDVEKMMEILKIENEI
ncbi:MAG: hypothetical protein AB7V07_05510 [Candidatus Delongbacteria bacterium]